MTRRIHPKLPPAGRRLNSRVSREANVDRENARVGGIPRVREARLRPEFAHLYPPLEPGRWEPAALLADRVVAWLLRQPNRGYLAPERALRSEHFEFRGGSDKPDALGDARTRQTPARDQL
jgi:hypothetical protein